MSERSPLSRISACPPGELAQAVESRGLSALFVTEHTHLPVEHGPTPWGSSAGT